MLDTSKKIKPLFDVTIKEGVMTFADKDEFQRYWKSLSGNYQLSLSRRRKPRSVEENSYYWGVIVNLLSNHIGQFPEVTHEVLKSLFLKEIRFIRANDKVIKVERVKSTTELSTFEAERYYEEIRQWSQEFLDCYIPLPEKVSLE